MLCMLLLPPIMSRFRLHRMSTNPIKHTSDVDRKWRNRLDGRCRPLKLRFSLDVRR
jgi:hypothetical protein